MPSPVWTTSELVIEVLSQEIRAAVLSLQQAVEETRCYGHDQRAGSGHWRCSPALRQDEFQRSFPTSTILWFLGKERDIHVPHLDIDLSVVGIFRKTDRVLNLPLNGNGRLCSASNIAFHHYLLLFSFCFPVCYLRKVFWWFFISFPC